MLLRRTNGSTRATGLNALAQKFGELGITAGDLTRLLNRLFQRTAKSAREAEESIISRCEIKNTKSSNAVRLSAT